MARNMTIGGGQRASWPIRVLQSKKLTYGLAALGLSLFVFGLIVALHGKGVGALANHGKWMNQVGNGGYYMVGGAACMATIFILKTFLASRNEPEKTPPANAADDASVTSEASTYVAADDNGDDLLEDGDDGNSKFMSRESLRKGRWATDDGGEGSSGEGGEKTSPALVIADRIGEMLERNRAK